MIQYRVTRESSVGILWAAFHEAGALQVVEDALQARAESTRLFEETGVSDLLLRVQANARDDKRNRPSAVVVDERWQFLAADCYLAFVDADISQWTAKSAIRSAGEALAGAMAVLERLGWLGVAQVAVEIGVDATRIAAFLSGSPVDVEALSPRSKRVRRRPKPKSLLEVQVLFRADQPSQQLAERHRISEILSKCAARSRLGRYVDSASSDEHFSFGYEVANVEKAQAAFASALIAEGLDASAISFAHERE